MRKWKKLSLIILFIGVSLIMLSQMTYPAEGDYTGFHFDTASSGNDDPRDITQYGNYIWIVEWTDEVYKYWMNGSYTKQKFNCDGDIQMGCEGITTNGTFIWTSDTSRYEIYVYWINGSFAGPKYNFSYGGLNIGQVKGITQNGTYIWLSANKYLTADRIVAKFWMNGSYTNEYFTPIAGNEPVSITNDGTYFWITNITGGSIYKYWMNGSYTNEYFTTVGTNNFGITSNQSYIWIVDNADDEVYRYELINTPPTSAMITTPSNNTNLSSNSITFRWKNGTDDINDIIRHLFWSANDTTFTITTIFKTLYTNTTTETLGDGRYYWKVIEYDGENNSTDSQTFTFLVDTIKPLISITAPSNNSNHSIKNVNINYTIADANIGYCLWTNNSGITNHSITCGTNITNINFEEGKSTVNVWINDTAGNMNFSSITFTIDTIKPNIKIVYPLNNTNHSTNNFNINYTVSDTNLGYCWWTKDRGKTNTTLTCGNNITGQTWFEGRNNITISANDTVNNINSSSVYFFVDTIYPTINFTSQVSANNTNRSLNNIYINVSVTETNPSNITFYLYNSTGQYNKTTYFMFNQYSNNTINWTNLNDDSYKYNVTIVDTLNQKNSTETRNILIDTKFTLPQIIYPTNISYNINISSLNYTVYDLHLQSCWYSTNNGATNISVACGTNLTGLTSNEGNNIWIVGANDTVNNKNMSRITFFKDTLIPTISITTPSNNSNQSIKNVNVNYTIFDVNKQSCLWTNNSGVTNNTITCGSNITNINFEDKIHTVDVWINDTIGNMNKTSITFLVETNTTITFCRDLSSSNTIYKLNNSIITTGDCFNINANNITVDMNQYSITGDDGSGDYGFYINDYDNLTIKNGTINNFDYGVYADTTSDSNKLLNMIITSCNSYGFYGETSKYNNFTNGNFSGNNLYDLYLVSGSTGNNVLNVSYPLDKEFVGGTSDLTRQWYFRVYVNDTNKQLVSNANVTMFNVNKAFVLNETTDSTGYTNMRIVTNYVSNAGVRTLYENFTVYALNYTAPPYVQLYTNESVNFTKTGSLYAHTLTLIYDITNPVVDYGASTPLNYSNASKTTIDVDVSITEANLDNITYTLYNETLPSGLVGYWSLDRDSVNQTDLSGYGNHGTVIGATFNSTGKIGGAYEFDGVNDLINISTSQVMNLTNQSFTFSAWIYPKSILTSNSNGLIDKWIASTGVYTYGARLILTTAGYLSLTVGNGSGTQAVSQQTFTYSSPIILNSWQFVVGSYNLTSLILCINTSCISTPYTLSSPVANLEISDKYFRIGSTHHSNPYFNGTIDEVMIFNRSLSATEVLELYNRRMVNQTTFTTQTYSINWTSLTNNVYHFFVGVLDKAKNYMATLFRTTTLDTTAPTISIAEPQAINYADNNTIYLNYSVTDNLLEVSTCWYNVKNSSGYLSIDNTTITNCANTTFGLPEGDIDYTLNLYANDTVYNNASSSVTFGIRTNAPSIILYTPIHNTYLNYKENIFFNFTAVDSDGLSTCELWSNWNSSVWLKNYTWINPNSAKMNYTIINLTDDRINVWNVWCNDTLDNNAFALSNYTFTIDTINPNVTFNTQNATTITSLSTTINYNVTDTNIDTCYFTLRDSSNNVHNYAENTSLTCGSEKSRAISTLSYGTYTFQLWGEDLADNLNSTTLTFTTEAPPTPPGPSGPGGGGPSPEPEKKKPKLTCNLTDEKWYAQSRFGTGSLTLQIAKNVERKIPILFRNEGSNEVKLNLKCIGGYETTLNETMVFDFCNYINISEKQLTLPPNMEQEKTVWITITPPENITYGENYFPSILIEDNCRLTFDFNLDASILRFGKVNKKIIGIVSWVWAIPVYFISLLSILFIFRKPTLIRTLALIFAPLMIVILFILLI